jgi:hypothetical protein
MPLPLDSVFMLLTVIGVARLAMFRYYDVLLYLGVVFGLFWLTTGISYWQQSRLMFPVEGILMLLCGAAFLRRRRE